ncbi:helix-turn-helix domain-containing protein [Nocardia sp. NPDC020380]|uniref:helix-turn-helix domain-containing protein n=1 Tax=Nocardia sp. NPDC020380 TaxID=3364309 RepID=UPI0037A4FC23
MTTASALSAFSSELRRWRALRRVSQLELAIRANTTQRYLSYLEQGRSRPGRELVVRLAESLDLSLRERNALLLAAGYTPAFTELALDAPELAPLREALRLVLDGHLPYPALIVDGYGTLIEHNAAFDIILEGCAPELLIPPVNVHRLALHPDGAAQRVMNLPEWGGHMIKAIRSRARISPDPGLDALIAELETYLPPTELASDLHDFAIPLRLRTDDGELCLLTTLTAFASSTDVSLSELRLKALLPADTATADILRRRDERSRR